jgi:aldehyde:ferredoxin oxidoreductase
VDDDVAAYNYTEPVQTVFMNPDVLVPGPGDQVLTRKGMTLGKEAFAAMRREFYQLRGWDPDTGVQLPDTLDRLDLPGRADQSLLR